MLNYDHIMIHFGELSTKGKNKKNFIRMLSKNVRHALKDTANLTYIVTHDYIFIRLNENDYEPIFRRLQDVSGIQSLSLVLKTDANFENLKNSCLELMKNETGKTFKVKTKRADKSYPMISDTINRQIGAYILLNSDWKVDVHNPDISLSIEIRRDAAYVYAKTVSGAGGYPLGVGGKILAMVSGGIDSPVACYLLMKRGITVQAVHFASPPYTSGLVIEKIKDLCKVLNHYQPEIKLYIVPFTKLQEAIYKNCEEGYAITIMRRMMYRISEGIARRHRCLAIANGESIGQVASQTLNSIQVINEVVRLPVIRPLAVFDKSEIIKLARSIGTFEISIRPFEDCCTIFAPKSPKTMPHHDKVEQMEASFDFTSLVNECIKETISFMISEKSTDGKYL